MDQLTHDDPARLASKTSSPSSVGLKKRPRARHRVKVPVDETRPQESTLHSVDEDENEWHLSESFCVILGELLE